MERMFWIATAFNQDLCHFGNNWPYSDPFSVEHMFYGSGCPNVNLHINGVDVDGTVKSAVGPWCTSCALRRLEELGTDSEAPPALNAVVPSTTRRLQAPAPFQWGTYVATPTLTYQCDGGYQVITSADVCEDAAAWVAEGNIGIFINGISASYQGEVSYSWVGYGCFWDTYGTIAFNTDQTLTLSNYPALCSPEEATSTAFITNSELRTAVQEYLGQSCSSDVNCQARSDYGGAVSPSWCRCPLAHHICVSNNPFWYSDWGLGRVSSGRFEQIIYYWFIRPHYWSWYIQRTAQLGYRYVKQSNETDASTLQANTLNLNIA